MLKFISILRVVLTVIIVIVPIFHVSYLISMKLVGVFSFLWYKFFRLTVFKKVRDQIIDKEYWNDSKGIDIKKIFLDYSVLNNYFKKMDGKMNILFSKLSIFFSNVIIFLKNIKIKKITITEKNTIINEQDTEKEQEKPVFHEDVIKKNIDKNSDFLWININLQAVFADKPIEKENKDKELTLEERETILKNKKLMERILYEAFVFKKAWRLDDYEKKIIEGLAIEPDDKELNKLLAEYYFSLWNHRKALSLLKKIIDSDPRDHKAVWQIWEIYLLGEEYDIAEILIQKAISMNSNEPKYYASLVELLYNTERKPDAVFVLEQNLIKLRPNNLDYIITLAELFEELWEIQNAKKYYFRILEQDPSNEKIKRKLQKLSEETIL